MSTLPGPDLLALPTLPPEQVTRTVLPNGLTVLVRRDTSAPVVAIVTYVKAGYFDETDDVVGIAHVLEHMFFKGTARRGVGEIARETKASGGYLNAHTIYDHTQYYTVLPASGFTTGLEVQADAYANSIIDADELARELEVIIQEAKRKADTPSAVATETLYAVLFDRHRMRRWRIGTEEQLRRLGRDDLLRFYRNFYRPSNTILVIVGDVDPDAALTEVDRRYGGLPNGTPERHPSPAEPQASDFRHREWEGEIAQTQLLLGWRSVPTLDPDAPLLDLAAAVLGTGRASRLYRAVRERQLAASVSAYHYTPVEVGVFAAHAESPPADALGAARGIWAQVRELRDGALGAHELERARRIFEARWMRRLETMEGQASHLAEWEALGDWTLGDRYLERMLTAQLGQVVEAAERHLAPDRAGVVVYRPRGAERLAEDAEEMRALLDRQKPLPLPAPPPRVAVAIAERTGASSLEREEAGVRVYRTTAGLPILVRHKTGTPMTQVGVFALGGAVAEPAAEAGLTSLLVRTMLKGTTRRTATQIAEDAELLGGSIGVSVGAESFGWSMSVPVRQAPAALELLSDIVQHATIPEEALETERTVAIADLRLLRDDMYRYPMRLALQAAYAGHPYGIPASGTEESLAGVTVERVRAWHEAQVLEAPLALGIVGDVDPDEIAAIAARDFRDVRPGSPATLSAPSWPRDVTHAIESRDKAQTALVLAFPSPSRRDDDRFAAHALATVASGLGGRLFEELRDKRSLAYTVHATVGERRLAGLFAAYIATSPEREEEARAGLLTELARFRDEPVTPEELRRAQTYMIGTHAIRQQSGSAVLGDVMDAWLFGELRELDEYEERIRGVTAERMQAVAGRYLESARRVEGIVRGTGKVV